MSNYASGARFEREVINLLRDAGFDVTRGAGSKGKLAGLDCDFVASKSTDKTRYEIGFAVFQAKRTKLLRRVKAAGEVA